jgi:hypothetical protein
VRTAKARLQRLKPHLFCGVYVVAKATTHKHSRVGTQTLKPVLLHRRRILIRNADKLLKLFRRIPFCNFVLPEHPRPQYVHIISGGCQLRFLGRQKIDAAEFHRF